MQNELISSARFHTEPTPPPKVDAGMTMDPDGTMMPPGHGTGGSVGKVPPEQTLGDSPREVVVNG